MSKFLTISALVIAGYLAYVLPESQLPSTKVVALVAIPILCILFYRKR